MLFNLLFLVHLNILPFFGPSIKYSCISLENWYKHEFSFNFFFLFNDTPRLSTKYLDVSFKY